jgi:hypothetical protein
MVMMLIHAAVALRPAIASTAAPTLQAGKRRVNGQFRAGFAKASLQARLVPHGKLGTRLGDTRVAFALP